MELSEVGRVCIKTKGRDAGSIVAIIDSGEDKNYAVIEGAKARRKKCNVRHLLFTDRKINIKKNAAREEIVEKLAEERVA
ncbi:MAG TPA: 50S ribosomal protein L14e [Candidatus Diapherotrites archaeon]|uniref:50S ribosomal protein L14e n=1 Tax=Candidatus Iainarchaeum sp. TaxID=3101447 RepID=A0A7J4IXH3_9ARCH|nr:50S ribosomal protein L14e [Candidatus Diapherotrites archaeon]